MKKVSARRTSAAWRAFSAALSLCDAGAVSVSCPAGIRRWMNLGQLPNASATVSRIPSPVRHATPLRRIRCRVPSSIASTPIRACGRPKAPSRGSPGAGMPASRIWRSLVARARPGPPAISDAQTRPSWSWLATTTNGCRPRNVPNSAGTKDMMLRPTWAAICSTPARRWTARSPSWNRVLTPPGGVTLGAIGARCDRRRPRGRVPGALSGSRDDTLAGGLACLHYPVRLGDLLEGEHPRGLCLVDARLGLGDDLAERDRGDRVCRSSYLEAAEEAELHAAGHVHGR